MGMYLIPLPNIMCAEYYQIRLRVVLALIASGQTANSKLQIGLLEDNSVIVGGKNASNYNRTVAVITCLHMKTTALFG